MCQENFQLKVIMQVHLVPLDMVVRIETVWNREKISGMVTTITALVRTLIYLVTVKSCRRASWPNCRKKKRVVNCQKKRSYVYQEPKIQNFQRIMILDHLIWLEDQNHNQKQQEAVTQRIK